VVIVFFGFLRCPDVCPAELLKLELVMKALGAQSRRVQVLFITLDPERDTPEELRAYATGFDPRFTGLTGTNAQVSAAAGEFNVQYARLKYGNDYSLQHSTATYLLDATGRLRLIGASATPVADYAHDIRALLAAAGAH